MFAPSSALPLAALFAMAHGHGVILGAQGNSGSPLSIGFQVNDAIARNCTTINPCQMDTTIIRDAEIDANVVNKCGRTELAGNIDIGANTENALAANQVTQVEAGSDVTVTIHQVNADGAGPYVCDIDMTSNGGVISETLKVKNNIPGANGLSQAKAQDFNITVTMPQDMKCTGASTGDICTIRCRNNAVAGPFGGEPPCPTIPQHLTDRSDQAASPSSKPTSRQRSTRRKISPRAPPPMRLTTRSPRIKRICPPPSRRTRTPGPPRPSRTSLPSRHWSGRTQTSLPPLRRTLLLGLGGARARVVRARVVARARARVAFSADQLLGRIGGLLSLTLMMMSRDKTSLWAWMGYWGSLSAK